MSRKETIAEYAQRTGGQVEVILELLRKADITGKKPEDVLTKEDKARILEHFDGKRKREESASSSMPLESVTEIEAVSKTNSISVAPENHRHLFIIVLGRGAKQDMKDLKWSEHDLERELDSVKSDIQLYKWPSKSKTLTVAIPIRGGAGVLILRRDKKNRHYFICTQVKRLKVRQCENSNVCYSLSSLESGCRIKFSDKKNVNSYLDDLLDCDVIEQEIRGKELWRPFVGGEMESRKWDAYLRICKDIYEKSQMAGLPAKVTYKREGVMEIYLDISRLSTEVDEEEIGKIISEAKGEIFKFNLFSFSDFSNKSIDFNACKLGKLLYVKTHRDPGSAKMIYLRMHFELDPCYSEDLKNEILKGEFFLKNESLNEEDDASMVEIISSNSLKFKELPDDAKTWDFYSSDMFRVHMFSGRAMKNNGRWTIDPESIRLFYLYLQIDFIGNLYQIFIMQNGLDQSQRYSIWEVLTEERPADTFFEGNPGIQLTTDSRFRKLNERQQAAVQKALQANELLLIWGPPGTGKTKVITEIARQESLQGRKTLIVSQSNLAVDNAIARLHDIPDVWPLRIAKQNYEPEADDKNKIPMMGSTVSHFFLNRIHQRLLDSRSEKTKKGVTALRRNFIKRLGEIQKIKLDADSAEILHQIEALYYRRLNVVGATLMISGKTRFDKHSESYEYKLLSETGIEGFDTVIVDEVSKAMPPELFLPVPLGKRLVLVGDHRQLPPVIMDPISKDNLTLEEWAEEVGISKKELDVEPTLFERLWNMHKKCSDAREMLTVQYRMHEEIQNLIEPFYEDDEGVLECGLSQEEQRKMSITKDQDNFFFERHVMWVRTRENENDRESSDGTSWINRSEIRIVGRILECLPRSKKLSVGVITFYKAQEDALCKEYQNETFQNQFHELTFGTVDRFQGRECDIIICSLVRNNPDRDIGFAKKTNRINVAFSRARSLLCIVGNEDTFCYGNKGSARDAYKKAYYACERAGGCISEGDLEKLIKNRGGHVH